MINDYLTDRIKISRVKTDKYGGKVVTVGSEIKARVELYVKTIFSKDGKDVNSQYKIYLPFDTMVNLGDKVQITKKNGTSYSTTNNAFEVQSIDLQGGFETMYKMVIV